MAQWKDWTEYSQWQSEQLAREQLARELPHYPPDYKYGGVGNPTRKDFRDWEWEQILEHQIKSLHSVLHLNLERRQAIIIVNLK